VKGGGGRGADGPNIRQRRASAAGVGNIAGWAGLQRCAPYTAPEAVGCVAEEYRSDSTYVT
jgi:hypothetical protein